MTTLRAFLFLVPLAALACSPVARSGPKPEPTKKMAPFKFAWPVGGAFDLVQTSVRKGESLELKTRATIEAYDGEQLAVSFEAPVLGAREKKLVAPGATHAYMDQWPPLVVKKKDGELSGFGAVIPDESHDTVGFRWRVWMTLVGFDLPQGEQRLIEGEVEVGDGLIAPVKITEAHGESPDGGHRVTITRVYEGDATKKLWVFMRTEAGAKKAELDAIKDATQEEKVVIDVDPKTLRPTYVDIQSTFTVTSSGRTEKVDVHAQRDTWTFEWSKSK